MRAVVKLIIQLGIIVLLIWLVVKYTTLDDKVVTFFRANSTTTQTGSITQEDPTVCTTPWGIRIPDGSSIYAYWTNTPGDAGECKEEMRTCNAGTLDGSYPYASCNANTSPSQPSDNGNVQVAQGAACTTPWGETLNDGAYIIAYESINSCRFEKRYCEDGRLNGSFRSDTCYSPTGMDQGGSTVVVSPTVTNISYGYVQGATSTSSEYEGPSRTSTNGNTTVIYSWNDNKTNPTSKSANDSQYIQPTNYRNYDLTQHGCTTPWGTYLDHASRVIAYKSSAPTTAGGSCAYERRTCFQGVLGGSYGYPTCKGSDSSKIYNNNGQDYYRPTSTTSTKSCTTAWGQVVRDGDYVLAYKSSYTTAGNACQGEYRYCTNGKLQGSYQNRSCSMSQEKYTCTLPWGGKIAHGSSVLAYANSSSPCGSQLRTCNYGRLSGNYRYSSCQSTSTYNHSCYLPWGGSIVHGASVITYNSPYGNCYSEKRTCINGSLNGSYQYSSCQNTNNNNWCTGWNCGYNNNTNNRCQLPWGGSISHGASVTAYNSTNGPCQSQQRTCYNGYLNGSYQHSYCNNNNGCYGNNCGGNNNNRSCTTPWGQTIAHGARVEAYQSTSSPCYKETRVCNNGSLNGSYQHSYCNATPTNGGTDVYGSREDVGVKEGSIDNLDTCNYNATSSYICGTEGTNKCTDYSRISCTSFSPMVCTYRKRDVQCVK